MSQENYLLGYEPDMVAFMSRRSVASHAAFIAPLLKSGQHLLDLGCGPGTISLDLARKVGSNGKVVAVDKGGEQFQRAQETARRESLPLSFQEADVHKVEFPAGTFDGVFAHALFEHIQQPVDVLLRVRRMLKGGGFIGLRSPDWGGFILEPCDEKTSRAVQARMELQTRHGGNVFAGRKLGSWLRAAGFDSVEVSGSYEIYRDVGAIVGHLESSLRADGQNENADALCAWGAIPHALFAQAWFEAIGIAPSKNF